MKAAAFRIRKVKFNREKADSQDTSVSDPSRSQHPELGDVTYPGRSGSFDSGSSSCSIGVSESDVDLVKMMEVHLEPGIKWDNKDMKGSVTGCMLQPFSTPIDSRNKFPIEIKKSSSISPSLNMVEEKYRISRKDETEGWVPYNEDCQRAIWSAWTKGDDFVCIERLKSEKVPDGRQYIIDLKTMQQKNITSGRIRPVQIAFRFSSRNFPQMWIEEKSRYPTREFTEQSCLMENETILHRLALSRLLCPDNVKRAISENMEPETLQSMEMDNHVDGAGNGQWNRFFHSFMQTVKEIPDYLGHLCRFASNPNGPHNSLNPFTHMNSNNLWRFVFVARSHDVLLKSSPESSPSKYGTHIDWFGLTSSITEFHCKPVSCGVVSMLVFLVLMPKAFDESRAKVVFINKIKDHLPVASITLRIEESALRPDCCCWEDRTEENPSSTRRGYQSLAFTDLPGWTSSVRIRPFFSPGSLL